MWVNIALFFYLLALLPKWLFDWIARGKKHPGLLNRLGAHLPDPGGRSVIWIHAVSVGEAKAARPLFLALKKEWPEAFFLVTTTTATGQAEAKRSLPADAYRYLLFDFTWIVRRWAQRLHPQLFLLIESDFWPNLLRAVRQSGSKVLLISGKLSSRSASRFARFPFFSHKLFGCFDALCVQNEEQEKRFLPLVPDSSRLFVTGNIKLDMTPQRADSSLWTPSILSSSPAVAIASTHAPEEAAILDALQGLDLFIFLAPRHPERIKEIEAMLNQKKIPYVRWTENKKPTREKIVLVDVMGQLPLCYSLSRFAILGGSFFPGVGGHNILEPCLYGTPVLFGPFMESQTEFSSMVQKEKAGKQIPLALLRQTLSDLLSDSAQEQELRRAALRVVQAGRGAVSRTLEQLRVVVKQTP